jgi:hypothetical protein
MMLNIGTVWVLVETLGGSVENLLRRYFGLGNDPPAFHRPVHRVIHRRINRFSEVFQ